MSKISIRGISGSNKSPPDLEKRTIFEHLKDEGADPEVARNATRVGTTLFNYNPRPLNSETILADLYSRFRNKYKLGDVIDILRVLEHYKLVQFIPSEGKYSLTPKGLCGFC